MRIHIERYSRSNFGATPDGPATPEAIEWAFHAVHEDWSSTICIASDDDSRELLITASNGSFAVFARIGGRFFDLVGESADAGDAEFVHGGQPAPHPRRKIVNASLAKKAALCFIMDPRGVVGADELTWEEQ